MLMFTVSTIWMLFTVAMIAIIYLDCYKPMDLQSKCNSS